MRKYESEAGWAWYRGLFTAATGTHTAIGEGTTDYSDPRRLPLILPRLMKHVPDCKYIYIVRHPLRRIESQWKLNVSIGYHEATPSYDESIRTFSTYVQLSSYWKVLDAYHEIFGPERLLVVFQEDMKAQPQQVLEQCFAHIGVDPTFHSNDCGDVVNPSEAIQLMPSRIWSKHDGAFSRRLRSTIPRPIKSVMRRMFAQPPVPELHWRRDTLDFVRSELQAGTREFLRKVGKPEDYWRFDDACLEPAVQA